MRDNLGSLAFPPKGYLRNFTNFSSTLPSFYTHSRGEIFLFMPLTKLFLSVLLTIEAFFIFNDLIYAIKHQGAIFTTLLTEIGIIAGIIILNIL